MLCQECNEREATLHFTKIVNGQKTETHLCDHCAREKGEIPGTNGFSIHQLLSGFLNFDQPVTNSQSRTQAPQVQQCSKCQMTYQQFARTGRFGCAECYETFSDRLDPILKRVHSGNTSHTGKIPKRIGSGIQTHRQIQQLKQQLQEHVIKEEFEEAAKLRDQIRSLENKVKEEKGE